MPIHIAIENNSKEIIEQLIFKGVDINARDILYQMIILIFIITII